MKKFLLILSVILSLVGCSGEKEKFPSKQINLVVQASPGGLSDQVSRKIAELMSEDLGVPIIPVYKPGSIGAVGYQFVKNAKNDGYTFGHAAIEISMVEKLGYTDFSMKDFTPLGQAYITVPVIGVGKNSKYKTFNEMVEASKENPGSVSIGTAGAGSYWHMAAKGVENVTGGAKFNFIPFEGSAPAVAAILGGHIDAVVVGPIEILANIESGDIVPILAIAPERSSTLPDTPTSVELGYDFDATHWGGFIAPAGIPEDAADILVASLEKAVKSDEYKEFMNSLAMESYYRSPEEFLEFATNAETEISVLIDDVNSDQ